MFFYWTREFVNERLKIGLFQSYRLIPATPSKRIRSDEVLSLLNRSRVGIRASIDKLPGDGFLLTPEETVAHFAESGVTAADLRRWTRRSRNPAPHFRLNKKTVRFSANLLDGWLAETSVLRGAWHNKKRATA